MILRTSTTLSVNELSMTMKPQQQTDVLSW